MIFAVSNRYKNRGGVYFIRSTITNDLYIGQTKCFAARFDIHSNALRKNRHPDSDLLADYAKKYGYETLVFSIYKVDDDRTGAYYTEQALIKKLKPSMNRIFEYKLPSRLLLRNGTIIQPKRRTK